jgi:hypothetical protein
VAETGQPYAFTGDDPLNATDPLGLLPYDCHTKAQCKAQAANRKRVAKEDEAGDVKGKAHIIDIAGTIGHFVAHHYGAIATVAAIGVAFVPGVDLVDLAVAGGTALASRIANRSTNDGSAPWSSQNLGANLTDTLVTAGSFGGITAPAAAADSAIGRLGTAGGLVLRARLAAPDIIGFGLSFTGN